MKPIDAAKLALLVAAIAVWVVGYRTQNRSLLPVAVGLVVVALLLRFFNPRAPGAPTL